MNRPDFLIIIQSRMSSTRLPGKVLLPFYKEETILDIIIENIKKTARPFVIATSTASSDDTIANFCSEHGYNVFRGSELNVLDRFIACADSYNAEYILRVCADNPFLSAEYIEQLMRTFDNEDYHAFCDPNGVPSIRKHWGLFAEIVQLAALKKTALQSQDPFYSEHVTNFIYNHPDQFNIKLMNAPACVFKRDDLRFTIDNAEDFASLKQLYAFMKEQYKEWTIEQLVESADGMPALKHHMQQNINAYSK